MLNKSMLAIAAIILLSASTTVKAGDLNKGEQDFITHCAACHGLDGKGDGDYAPLLTRVPIDLTRKMRNEGGEFPREKLKKIVDGREMPRAHGTAIMPIWGNWFSEQALTKGKLQNDKAGIEKMVNERLENLMTYLETIQE